MYEETLEDSVESEMQCWDGGVSWTSTAQVP